MHSVCVSIRIANQFIRKNVAHQWLIKICAKNNLSENKLWTTDKFKEKWFIRTILLAIRLTKVWVLFSVSFFPLILCVALDIIDYNILDLGETL